MGRRRKQANREGNHWSRLFTLSPDPWFYQIFEQRLLWGSSLQGIENESWSSGDPNGSWKKKRGDARLMDQQAFSHSKSHERTDVSQVFIGGQEDFGANKLEKTTIRAAYTARVIPLRLQNKRSLQYILQGAAWA